MDDALEAFRELRDVIVKPLFGSGGRGMVRVSDEEIAYRVFRALDLERAVYYLQEALPHPGRDVRAFVVGDRVVAAAWRCADGWRTNVARGARVERAELPPEWHELSIRAAAPSPPSTRASICCRCPTDACSSSRSTASRAGRACSPSRRWTWPAPSSSGSKRWRDGDDSTRCAPRRSPCSPRPRA